MSISIPVISRWQPFAVCTRIFVPLKGRFLSSNVRTSVVQYIYKCIYIDHTTCVVARFTQTITNAYSESQTGRMMRVHMRFFGINLSISFFSLPPPCPSSSLRSIYILVYLHGKFHQWKNWLLFCGIDPLLSRSSRHGTMARRSKIPKAKLQKRTATIKSPLLASDRLLKLRLTSQEERRAKSPPRLPRFARLSRFNHGQKILWKSILRTMCLGRWLHRGLLPILPTCCRARMWQ